MKKKQLGHVYLHYANQVIELDLKHSFEEVKNKISNAQKNTIKLEN